MPESKIDDEMITLAFLVLGYPGKPDQDAATIECGTWMEGVFGKLGTNKPVGIDYKSSFTKSLAGARELAELAPDTRVVIGFAGALPSGADKLEAIRQEIVSMPENVFLLGIDTILRSNTSPTHRGRATKWATAMQKEFEGHLTLLDASALEDGEAFEATVQTLQGWLEPKHAAV